MYASILYLIFKIYYDKLSKSRRCGGMADAADSKSAGGNIVRVQVPPPALKKEVAFRSFLFSFPKFTFERNILIKVSCKDLHTFLLNCSMRSLSSYLCQQSYSTLSYDCNIHL